MKNDNDMDFVLVRIEREDGRSPLGRFSIKLQEVSLQKAVHYKTLTSR